MQHRSDSQMSVRDAAYHTVRGYPGGAGSLAPRLGLSAQVLNHKTNPNNTTRYNLSLEEAVELQAMTDNYSILYVMARELGHTCIRESTAEGLSINEGISQILKDMGELVASVSQVMTLGKITDNELRKADEKFSFLMNHVNELRGLLANMNGEQRGQIIGRVA